MVVANPNSGTFQTPSWPDFVLREVLPMMFSEASSILLGKRAEDRHIRINAQPVGAPVLLVPGFLEWDRYMKPLGQALAHKGFTVFYTDPGRVNCGFDSEVTLKPLNFSNRFNSASGFQSHVEHTMNAIAREHGSVHLIGHSLGAINVRMAAKSFPENVASVTSIAGPINPAALNAPDRISPFYPFVKALNPHHPLLVEGENGAKDAYREPLECPSLSIIAGRDKVVAREACRTGESLETQVSMLTSGHYDVLRSPELAEHISDFVSAHQPRLALVQ